MNKDGRAFMIFGFCLGAGLGACTGAGTFPAVPAWAWAPAVMATA